MTAPVYLALIGLVVLWGSAFPLIKVGLEGLSVPHLTLLRHLISSLVFLPVLLMFRQRLWPRREDLLGFLLLGSVGIGVYHLSLNAGELRVSAGATSLIIAAAPALAALLARFTLGDRLPVLGWVGSGISFLGIVAIVLGDSRSLRFDAYALLVLLSALCAAVYLVGQKPFLKRYTAMQVTAFATWGATLPLLVFVPGLAADMAGSGRSVGAAVYLGVFPSAVAYSLLAFALMRNAVSLVAAYLYTIPVFALLFSWILLAEVPGLLTLAGGVVVVAGIALVNWAKSTGARAARLRGGSTTPAGEPATALHRPRR